MPPTPLFLRACAGEACARPPLWIMRQAGRYLPEYRALRQKHDFLTVCRTPELAAEVTLQPLRRFAFDAAIVFSDIMMPLESMGVELAFSPGPHVKDPIRTAAQVDALRLPTADEIAPYVAQTIKLLRAELTVPLIGFAGAPLTLAAYLIEGKGSKDFLQMRRFMYAEPAAFARLLQRLAQVMGRYLAAQVRAGAQAVQLFDSWAGLLAEAEYRQFAMPANELILAELAHLAVPRIFFAQDAAALMPAVAELPAEVLGLDWRQPMAKVRQIVGPNRPLQGNLDPACLFAAPAEIAHRARQLIQSAGGPHIFNLGHGITPETPIASVHALLAAVHDERANS
jgi:uroporphyrinogen decarboxylase